MTTDGEERNRVLGFPVGSGRRREGVEEQHVMGLPASLFENANLDWLDWLVRPVREYRRRHLDTHATGDDKQWPAGAPRSNGTCYR